MMLPEIRAQRPPMGRFLVLVWRHRPASREDVGDKRAASGDFLLDFFDWVESPGWRIQFAGLNARIEVP